MSSRFLFALTFAIPLSGFMAPSATTRPAGTSTEGATTRDVRDGALRPGDSEAVYGYPKAGDIEASINKLKALLKKSPRDDVIRMRLGFAEFLRSVEALEQAACRYDLHAPMGVLPFPFPRNPNPERISYEDTRRILEQFLARLEHAESTLAGIHRDDVAFRLNVSRIVFDVDSDGYGSLTERLSFATGILDHTSQRPVIIRFDAADVHWLRGYCHLLSGVCEIALAHDWRACFEHAGQLFFDKIETPYAFLREQSSADLSNGSPPQFIDAIAGAHLLHFPVKEPARMKSALAHFKATIEQSRAMWACAMKETDNELEWIPNPNQDSPLEMPISRLMTTEWLSMLDEADAILDGRKLIPFWRRGETRGLNLHRVLTEPRDFDVWLWLQGTAAIPYLEDGTITAPERWSRLRQSFGQNLTWYLFWLN